MKTMTEGNEQALDGRGETEQPMRIALGVRLRDLRRESGKSLREAAAHAGLSATFISLVERGQTEIALSRLIRLVDAYDANVADLLSSMHEAEVEFVAAGRAYHAPREAGDPKVTYLASRSWQLQPFRIEVEPGGLLDGLSHAGEEFIHCIAGELEMTVDEGTWVLAAGDTIVIPPRAPHAYRNHGTEMAVGVGAVMPPHRTAHRPH